MKLYKYLIIASFAGLAGCSKLIDLTPQSNINSATYYSNLSEISTALTGCYNGMRTPLTEEWTLTELRSDNTIQGVPASTATPNRDLSDLDMFFPNVSHQGNYSYWLNTHYNIRNVNFVLNSLNVNYSPAAGTLSFDPVTIPVTAADIKSYQLKQLLLGPTIILIWYVYMAMCFWFTSLLARKTQNRLTVHQLQIFIN